MKRINMTFNIKQAQCIAAQEARLDAIAKANSKRNLSRRRLYQYMIARIE
jgi:hypothetical protein